jgi:hypothetical protein
MRHVLPLHTRPVWHRRDAQHGSPEPPHGPGLESETPTSGVGCVESLALSRGGCATSSGVGESGGRGASTLVSAPGDVSMED